MSLAKHIANRDKAQLSWYEPTLPTLKEDTRSVFLNYSKIPKDALETHLYTMRDRAFDLCAYPCIGMWLFLDMSIARSPCYEECLMRLKCGELLLEAGACMAQNLRLLAAEGAPSDRMVATDLRPEFFDVAYDLFNDRRSFQAAMIGGDLILDEAPFAPLEGSLDMIYSSFLLHLFSLEYQKIIAKKMAGWLKKKHGSLIFGRHMGTGGLPNHVQLGTFDMYKHNTDSFAQFWHDIGKEMGLKFHVEASLDESMNGTAQAANWDRVAGEDSMTFLVFAVRLVVE